MKKAKNIGIDVKAPKEACEDKHCPFHGDIKLRGRIFTGTVIKTDIHRSATVGWTIRHYLPKYERYELRKSRVRVHNPDCIKAQIGDKVKIAECRPISKMKHFVIIEK
ncbi:MAG: 30S ribosomal protein S17 [archaeon]